MQIFLYWLSSEVAFSFFFCTCAVRNSAISFHRVSLALATV